MSLPIGFFSPLPLPIMVPFMFMQSAAMALGFGSFFQYGKRKISSMSNEEFNELTPEALTAQLMSSVNNMIPTVNESFHQMEQMNVMILEAMSKYFSQGVEFLDKWIIGRGENFVSNFFPSETGDNAGIPDFIPTASATDSGQTGGTKKFADFYENEASQIPFKLLADIVEKILSNKMPGLSIEKRTGYVNAYKKMLARQPVPKNVPDAIKASGAAGIVKEIATMYAQMKDFLAGIKIAPAFNKNKLVTGFLNLAKKYNQFVAVNRKPNLQIDTAKSLAALRLIPKT